MDIVPLALRARAVGARISAWALRRARSAHGLAARLGEWALRRGRERSTWIGLGMIATAAGKSIWGDRLTSLADVIPMMLGVGGAAIAAASNKSHQDVGA